MLPSSTLAVTAATVLILSFAHFVREARAAEAGTGWEYIGPLGPEQWHTEFPDCGGVMQSPINIDTGSILYDPNLHSFDLRKYHVCSGCTMVLENVNGHTASVKYSGDPVFITGGSLPADYILDEFHFHWGGSDNVGSEHLLDNRQMPMEMHIVHHMKQYNRNESVSKPYGLAVLGFFFTLGDHNPNFSKLLSHFPNITHKNEKVELEPFSLADLLPPDAVSYYRYYGSLTTPPCHETVIWSLFADRIQISREQLEVFRTLKTVPFGGSEEVSISNDYRPIQDLHERRVTSNSNKVLNSLASEIVKQLKQEIEDIKATCTSRASLMGMGSLASNLLALAVAFLMYVRSM